MMSAPDVIATAIPIPLPVARVLRDNVIPPVRGKTISAADLAGADSVTSQIRSRTISCLRELIRTIDAIDISARELIRTDRSDPIRTELH
jgi:hypothetical protein